MLSSIFSFKPCFFFQYVLIAVILIGLPAKGIALAQEHGPTRQIPAVSSILAIPENGTAIVVDKSTQTLFVYAPCSHDSGTFKGPAQKILTFPCSTGEVSGPKHEQGDKKTPEGIYFLVDEYEDRYLTPVYGKRAFPTDYPNYMDKQQGKTGSAIWIHGTDKPLQPMGSNGCITLENKDIMALADKISLHKTPVILMDQMRSCPLVELQTQKIQAEDLIQSWLSAMESGAYHDYLQYYSPSHMPDMFWWNQWSHFRKWAKKTGQKFSLEIQDTGIYRFQELTVAIMDLYLNTESASTFLGTRKLFFQHQGDSTVIVGDVYQKKSDDFAGDAFPLIAAANLFWDKQNEVAQVKNIVKEWLRAWSAKDMRAYSDFYAPDFTGDGLSRKEWLHRKTRLARRYKSIQVTGEQFTITKNNHIMVVRFFQKYRATGFSTNGYKELQLAHMGGSWKIFQEIWKGK